MKVAVVAIIVLVVVGAALVFYQTSEQSINPRSDNEQLWNGVDSDRSWYDDEEDSFTISTAAQLKGFADLVNIDDKMFAGKTVTLTKDIDLGGHIWEPIGNYISNPVRSAFKGTFDGDGHTVSNLYIDEGYIERSGSAWMGFFTMIRDNATVENLTLKDARLDMPNDPNQAGILAAMLYNSHVINCHVSGTITAVNPSKWLGNGEYIGGMIGAIHSETYASMERCSADVIMDCYGQASAGGLVGTAGFNGYSKPNAKIDISDCFTTGIINVATKNEQFLVAGLIGFMGDLDGRVTTDSVSLRNSYSTAEVISADDASILTSNVAINARGGFVEKCYWDVNIHTMAGILEGGGNTASNNQGKTTEEMKSAAFVDLLNDGREEIWFFSAGSTPSLSPPAYNPIGGEVTITGTLQSGKVLTAVTSGLPNNLGDLTYTWYRSGNYVPLQSGAKSTYLTVPADVGRTITVVVSADNYDGTIEYTTGTIAAAPVESRWITAYSDGGSTIHPAGMTQVNYGGSLTYEFFAKQGYEITAVVIDGVELAVIPDTYTFSNVRINHTISIYSAIPEKSVTVSVDYDERYGNVEFSINGSSFLVYEKPLTVTEGTNVVLKAIPSDGKSFDGWEGDISSSADTITISSINDDMFLVAKFSENSSSMLLTILLVILAIGVIIAVAGVIRNRKASA
jgi:hypothetical protein